MPNRILRGALRQSQRWNACSLFEQNLYVRLLMLVDDYGRYEAHSQLLANEAFPYGDPEGLPVIRQSIDGALLALKNHGLLELYESDGKQYLELTRWKERVRTQSRFPERVVDEHAANDSHLTAKRQSSAGLARAGVGVGVGEGVGGGRSSPEGGTGGTHTTTKTNNLNVELPEGFPKTQTEAASSIGVVGCTEEFAIKVWNIAMSRGGTDAKGIPIRSWQHHLSAAHSMERASPRAKANGEHPAHSLQQSGRPDPGLKAPILDFTKPPTKPSK